MKFTALFVLASAATVFALPVEDNSNSQSPKAPATVNVNFYNQINFKGTSYTQTLPIDKCTALTLPSSINGNVQSLKLDVGGTSGDECSFFLSPGCKGGNFQAVQQSDMPKMKDCGSVNGCEKIAYAYCESY